MGEEQPAEKKRSRAKYGIIAAIVVVVIALGVFVGYSVMKGDLAPSDAAAKYNGMTYLPEGEVTDYIELYRKQMGLADASDEDWATFLAAYNLTPQRLRYTTINQLIKDKLVAQKANDLNITASEEEVEATIDTLRNSLGLGDEEILQKTLAAQGQTLDGLREVYRKAIVQRLVLSSEVPMPKPTDTQVKDYMKDYNSTLDDPTIKHSYCFRLVGLDEGGSRDRLTQVQQLRNQFAEGDKTPDAFAELVKQNSNDDELIANEGANGWNIGETDYSDSYLETLSNTQVGDVSNVFVDDGAYAFIWINDSYALPVDEAGIDAIDVSLVPQSLWNYLSDSAAYLIWQDDCQAYLDQLLAQADVVYYPMPDNVSYNVDMSKANVQLEQVDDSSSSS